MIQTDTIVAQSTPSGEGAIGVIRVSGPKTLEFVDRIFYGKNLKEVAGNTVHYGKIKNESGQVVDECLATVFRAPRSYTKEDCIEISCHGSSYIIQEIIRIIMEAGARPAKRGEFTMRAFLNGQLDLSQAEAVADLIASDNAASHQMAMNQMRGGFSDEIKELRQELIDFAALIELELDFGEEDVEFADRGKLETLVADINTVIQKLIKSFQYGNAIKKGIPVAIVGSPNVGKSTLLNALLNEEKAIVSDIAGTTRDVIEDQITIEGIPFRFIDTAGIRDTDDTVESIGIERAKEQIIKAQIVIFITEIIEDHNEIINEYKSLNIADHQKSIILLNKADAFHTCHSYDVEEAVSTLTGRTPTLAISAKEKTRIEELKSILLKLTGSADFQDQTIVNNSRHYDALFKSKEALNKVLYGLQSGITGDFIAMDIRQALHHLGEITGEIHTDDLLDSIFGRFCIGK